MKNAALQQRPWVLKADVMLALPCLWSFYGRRAIGAEQLAHTAERGRI